MNKLKVGIKVTGPHGNGTIIAKNKLKGTANEQLEKAVEMGLESLLSINSFYGGDDFPWVVEFEDGYIDVYSTNDLQGE